jgi:hypothetical protein
MWTRVLRTFKVYWLYPNHITFELTRIEPL